MRSLVAPPLGTVDQDVLVDGGGAFAVVVPCTGIVADVGDVQGCQLRILAELPNQRIGQDQGAFAGESVFLFLHGRLADGLFLQMKLFSGDKSRLVRKIIH